MDKICIKCKISKSLDEFHNKPGSTDGKHSFCKECAILGSKIYYQDNKKEILSSMIYFNRNKKQQIKAVINQIKESLKCVFCKENTPCCLDFHHLDSNNKNNEVSYLASAKNIHKVVEEINKCICVCSNCHRKIHADFICVENLKPIEITYEEFIDRMKIVEEKIPTVGTRKRYKKEKIRKPRPRKFNPSKEELFKLINEHSFVYIGKLFGVSDSAVRKRCKLLGI